MRLSWSSCHFHGSPSTIYLGQNNRLAPYYWHPRLENPGSAIDSSVKCPIHRPMQANFNNLHFRNMKHQRYSSSIGCLTAAVNYYRGLQRYQPVPYPHGNKIKVEYICILCVINEMGNQ